MSDRTPHTDTMPAKLMPPNDRGYLLLAATVDRRLPFLPNSRRKKALLAELSDDVAQLATVGSVEQAYVFEARLVAPGMGHELLRTRSSTVTPADFDVLVLVETHDPAGASALREDARYLAVKARLSAAAQRTYEVAARNVRRIADVDHSRRSVFLFNFFYADDSQRLIQVWEDTAGWFVAKTSLPNSTVFEPLPGEADEYGIINHASWPHFRTFLPHLLLRPSFRRFVLATFAANNVAAQPILFRRLEPSRIATEAVGK